MTKQLSKLHMTKTLKTLGACPSKTLHFKPSELRKALLWPKGVWDPKFDFWCVVLFSYQMWPQRTMHKYIVCEFKKTTIPPTLKTQ